MRPSMAKSLVLTAALSLAVATGAGAFQNGGGSFILSNIDIPAQNATVAASRFYIAGWALNCDKGGQQPFWHRVLFFHGNGLVTEIPMYRAGPLYRPDVKAAFAAVCPELGSWTGVALFPARGTIVPPLGHGRLVVEWSDGYTVKYDQQNITLR